MELKDFIKVITERPAMYGVNRIEDLYLIIRGFLYAHTKTDLEDLMYNFRIFVNEKWDCKEDAEWCRLIRFYSGSDQHSLELFKSLWEEFVREK